VGRKVFDAHVAEFTKGDVLALAGERSCDRGIGYVRAVDDLEAEGDVVYATVQGNERYEVELNVGPSGLNGSCDCPWGEEGNFCKLCCRHSSTNMTVTMAASCGVALTCALSWRYWTTENSLICSWGGGKRSGPPAAAARGD